ncbi:MAG TPA: BatA and WFA domain-containing protein [Vicinamibacterales bacterium]|nr:BatA and WFA domain-containing protein [Vicinamibacterales bacterium]
MAFLTPFFLLGLGAIAIPVLIHLIQREKKRVIEFPSLMFVRRIPYQSVRRRRIRHWWLLLMRAAAILLVVAAFARPFMHQGSVAAAVGGGAREIVILLDQSASMGYGDHWTRAKDAARTIVRGMGADDRATLVLFNKNAEENMRATSDRARLEAAVNAAKVGSGATRFGPALKLAESILSRSPIKRREAVLISDFQRSGWSGSEEVRFPEGMTVSTVSVASPDTANLAVPSVAFGRASFSGQERLTVTAGLSNKGDQPLKDIPVTLTIDGHEIQTEKATVAAHASGSVSFTQFTLSSPNVRGSVKAGTDLLPADNTFYFVLAPSAPVSVVIVDSGDRAASSLFLAKALSIGTTPVFQVDTTTASRLTPAMLDKAAVVILNDTAFPPGAGGGVLKKFLERGGGLLVVSGDHATWPQGEAELLPGRFGATVDRTDGRNGSLGYLDYSHSVFEVFKAPRSGDFSAAHVFRYRALQTTPADRILARFDDGAVAAAERKTGGGRAIVWTSTLDDSWTDIAVKPIFLPLVHQLIRYLAHYEPPTSWLTVGQVLDLTARAKGRGDRADRIVVTPSGERISQSNAGEGNEGLLELNEQGVYEIRSTGAASGRPEAIAVNIDPAESDLSAIDPRELVAAVTGHASPTATAPVQSQEMTREESERRQSLWWYLLMAGLLLLAAETVISNHLSRKEKFL